mmetsp:Transcript_8312/g.22074  ORF Transcript_8312/g.22074 Transcript_8312/m.22074 type:complete len:589 (-) Transcript_8312:372-2138(-)
MAKGKAAAEPAAVESGEEPAKYVMDYVVGAVDMEIDHMEVLNSAMDKAVGEALDSALEAIRMALFEKDAGEGYATDNPDWLPDGEPETLAKDSWARGAVPVRRKIHLGGFQLNGPRKNSDGSKLDGKDGMMSTAKSFLNTNNSLANTLPSPIRTATSQRVPSRDGNADPQARRAPTYSIEPLPLFKKSEDEEEEFNILLRHRVEATKTRQKLSEDDRIEMEKLQKIKKELKDKDFTFDAQGNIIVVNHVDPDKIPNRNVNMKVNLKEKEALVDEAKKSFVKKGDKQKRQKKEDGKKEGAFEESIRTNPPLTEVMDLQPGVTLLEDGKSKSGPDTKNDPKKKSRKEFLRTFGVGVESASKEVPDKKEKKGEERNNKAAKVSRQAEAPATSSAVAEKGVNLGDVSDRGGKEKKRNAGSEGAPPLAGVQPQPPRGAKGSSSPTGRGGRGRLADPLESNQAESSALSKSQIFSAHPDVASPRSHPSKGGEGRDRALGARPRYPRDRPYVSQTREHLPPPIFPAQVGHGFVTSYLAAQNNFAPTSSNVMGGESNSSSPVKLPALATGRSNVSSRGSDKGALGRIEMSGTEAMF